MPLSIPNKLPAAYPVFLHIPTTAGRFTQMAAESFGDYVESEDNQWN
jgi:hypothetical protein